MRRALDYLNQDNWELSLVITGDEDMRDYNRLYRGRDEATDVLSFCPESPGEGLEEGDAWPLFPGGGERRGGDIIISLDSLFQNSLTFAVPPALELGRLIIHGILHLLGEDHQTNCREEPMLKHQERILENLGSPEGVVAR
ncbi:MAG: rRNA maturation RNase YbeY [Spirochaetales bacterium]|nr:rRNA maturation RNase YbeY [Spirochaetales bacterium]